MDTPKVHCSICGQLLKEIVEHHIKEHDLDWPQSWETVGGEDD